jgi:hypothetical protein
MITEATAKKFPQTKFVAVLRSSRPAGKIFQNPAGTDRITASRKAQRESGRIFHFSRNRGSFFHFKEEAKEEDSCCRQQTTGRFRRGSGF